MRNFVFTLILSLLFAVACSNKGSRRVERYGWEAVGVELYGDVESVRVLECFVDEDENGNEVILSPYADSWYKFNERGDVSERHEYIDEHGRDLHVATYCKYNSRGDIAEMIGLYERDTFSVCTVSYKYDDEGKKLEMREMLKCGMTEVGWYYRYKYDSRGFMIENRQSVIEDGEIPERFIRIEYTKDAEGRTVCERHYDTDGKLGDEYVFEYDSQNCVITKDYVTHYDSYGNEIERKYREDDGTLSPDRLFKYKYDSKGNAVEFRQYEYSNGRYKIYDVTKLQIVYR